MATLTIRGLDPVTHARLRVEAARHGRSMEAEVRAILTDAVTEPDDERGLVGALLDRFGELGGVDLDIPARATEVRAADFDS